ncbi:MAG: hypothetical protein EHM48_03950 [Planctomycetaceae bacterium]|nr:MAG: hypothetical protein EHM48_03950 [Planctomycetaceae bacterium]
MSEYTYEQLKALTVAELREIAKGIENDELEGFSTKHKEQLLPILCKVLHISMHHVAAGDEKVRLKAMIHKFQAARSDKSKAAVARHQIHVMKHKLRKMAETTK